MGICEIGDKDPKFAWGRFTLVPKYSRCLNAKKFLQIWNEYKNDKDITRRRLYLETIEVVIPKSGKVYVFEPGANNILPLLNLSEGVK